VILQTGGSAVGEISTKIQSAFAGHAKRLKRLHDAELAAIFVYHPDFASTDAFVDANAVALLPEIPICDNSP
jgi:hypothetical protein